MLPVAPFPWRPCFRSGKTSRAELVKPLKVIGKDTVPVCNQEYFRVCGQVDGIVKRMVKNFPKPFVVATELAGLIAQESETIGG